MPVWELVEDYWDENSHLTHNQMKIKEVENYIRLLDSRIKNGEEAKKKKAEWVKYLEDLKNKE